MTTPPKTSHHPACKLCRGTREEREQPTSQDDRGGNETFSPDPRPEPELTKAPKGVVGVAFHVKLVSGLD